jgi:uncharacterized protein YjbI with pentapeptide repeats
VEENEIKTIQDFLAAYKNGQRLFINLDLEEEQGGVSGEVLQDCIFENCFLFLDFRNADLTNSDFLSCNIKTADFRNAILTNTLFKNCSVESIMFKGAKVDKLIFEENYCYGSTVGQKDFEEHFKESDEARK